MGYGELAKVIGNVNKLWINKWKKACECEKLSVTLGRGGRVMSSSILYKAEIHLVFSAFFRIFVLLI